MLDLRNVTVRAGTDCLLSDLTMAVAPAQMVAVIGPNGAGKSTLMGLLSGERRPDAGHITLDGRTMTAWPLRALARRRAVMAQHSPLSFPFSVAEVVGLGLRPRASHGQPELIQAAMAAAHVDHLAHRLYPTLSGGERQRTHFARALVQVSAPPPGQAPFLLLDEPTASLDPGHQHLVLTAARDWMARTGGAVVAVLHDLTLAAQYADRVVVLARGRAVWDGAMVEIPLAALARAFGLEFRRVGLDDGHWGLVALPPARPPGRQAIAAHL